MGNFPNQEPSNESNNQTSNFLNKINRVQSSYLQKFGKFNLYQLNQKPYDYYIEYIENIVPNSQLLNQKLQFYKNLPKNKNLVPIQHIQTFKKKQMCAQFDGLRIFCIYYNFTLEDAIKLKIKQRNSFMEADVIYILKSLLSIGKFYQNQLKSKFYSGIFKSKNIFISPEGHVKIYPFNDSAFLAYLNKKEVQEASLQNSQKKISLQFSDQKIKPYFQTRDQSSIFKSSFYKSKQGFKKPKLTTTLKKDRSDLQSTQQVLRLKGIQSHKISRNVSNTVLSHQQSSQTFNYLFDRLNEQNPSHNRDLFDLGLLMMQIFLLNQQGQYYKQKQSQKRLNCSTQIQNPNNRKSNTIQTILYTIKQKQAQDFTKNLKYLQEYQTDTGLIPNIDLICFSLKKLLPKKNISKFLLKIIERLILGGEKNGIQYDQLYDWIEKQQEMYPQIRYCLKFKTKQEEKQQNIDGMRNKSYSALNRTTDFYNKYSYTGGDSVESGSKELIKNDMKIISPTKKLEDFLNYNNLAQSMVFEEQISKDKQVLSSLKKSRKLVPHKIRSISMKLNQNNQ